MRRIVLTAFVALATALMAGGAVAQTRARDVFTCEFPTHGTVIIDTAPEGASITVGGVRYPAQSGSYFYQGTEDAPLVNGDPIVIMFGPDLTWWDFQAREAPPANGEA